MKYLLLIVSFFFTADLLAQRIIEDILDKDGEVIGSVWTDREEWLYTCGDEPCPDKDVNPVVCMEYSNDALVPILCRLEVSAFLAEPSTDFIKIVTDVREEIVFFNQTHVVCFNFAKDEYNLWKLLDTSDPIIECTQWDSGTD